ncbi:MAG: FoF1 ATP synthase subunit gamma [Candidatus Omnitrophota bacterium]
MATLSSLKKEYDFNVELASVIDVMKGIAASQFQSLQRRRERFKKFLDSFSSFFQLIDFSAVAHPFGRLATERVGIIMVTSDEGFMGGLNTHVINAALAHRRTEAELIIVGDRGAAYLKGLGEQFTYFPGVTDENKYELAIKLRDYIMQQSKRAKFGMVLLSYPLPVSFTFQKVEVIKLLPCTELFEKKEDLTSGGEKVIVESHLEDIIEHLVAEWISEKLYEVFEDSKLSEFAARAINLEQSYQNVSQSRKIARYRFFQAKHTAIDRSMRETFASQLLRKKDAVT